MLLLPSANQFACLLIEEVNIVSVNGSLPQTVSAAPDIPNDSPKSSLTYPPVCSLSGNVDSLTTM